MFYLQVTLNNYSFENVAFHVLHQRFPLYSPRTLSDWFDHNSDLYRFVPTLNICSLSRFYTFLPVQFFGTSLHSLQWRFLMSSVFVSCFSRCSLATGSASVYVFLPDEQDVTFHSRVSGFADPFDVGPIFT